MDVLSRSQNQKIVTSSVLGGLFISIAIFMVLIISHASRLADSDGRQAGNFGSLKLFELYKTPVASGGYSGGINLSVAGVMTLLIMGCLLGFALAMFRINLRKVNAKA